MILTKWIVVLDTTKVQIFKQITTEDLLETFFICCFRYHKGTDFQANHNEVFALQIRHRLFQIPQRYRFSSKSQPKSLANSCARCCFRYHKGTDFQANHNHVLNTFFCHLVVLDTTKVQIFKQITTFIEQVGGVRQLFQIPQRYRFSSKSQQNIASIKEINGCFRYHKGTDFQANHNRLACLIGSLPVVLDTTKVQIFKQITTIHVRLTGRAVLFQIPQRYRFSSKSQPIQCSVNVTLCCFRYHKGTDFQANHNPITKGRISGHVVLDTTKVQIFKQITTYYE